MRPSVVTFGAVMQACIRADDMDGAFGVLTLAKEAKVELGTCLPCLHSVRDLLVCGVVCFMFLSACVVVCCVLVCLHGFFVVRSLYPWTAVLAALFVLMTHCPLSLLPRARNLHAADGWPDRSRAVRPCVGGL